MDNNITPADLCHDARAADLLAAQTGWPLPHVWQSAALGREKPMRQMPVQGGGVEGAVRSGRGETPRQRQGTRGTAARHGAVRGLHAPGAAWVHPVRGLSEAHAGMDGEKQAGRDARQGG